MLEVAILEIVPGREEAYREAFRRAQVFLTRVDGYQRHELRQCLEASNRFLLLVWWDSLESHTRNFRESDGYREWSALLHPFYDPFPAVEHYVPVETGGGESLA